MAKCVFLAFSLNNSSVSDYFTDLANTFSKKYKVLVFTDVKTAQNTLSNDVIVKYWPSGRPTQIKDFIFFYKETRKFKPSLCISVFGAVNVFLIIGFIARVKARIAWVRTLSTQFPQRKILLCRKAFVYKLATKIIANSKATKFDVSEKYFVNKNKINVIPNAVRDYNSVLPEIKTDRNKIVYVGRLHPSKGVDVLLRALAILIKTSPNVNLDIIGDGSIKSELELMVGELKLNNRVCFLGPKSKNEVLTRLKGAYCSVVPSYSEAFGFTVIEAMSVGTCVVGANNTGIKETIQDNKTGLLFETGDHEMLAEKFRIIYANQNFRDKLALNGFLSFLKFYEVSERVKQDFMFFEGCM